MGKASLNNKIGFKMFNIKECDNEMNLTIVAFSNELKNIRTGRVSPDILKTVMLTQDQNASYPIIKYK